jgi:DNA-directed RNA polymerase specialized sigma24 family protein
MCSIPVLSLISATEHVPPRSEGVATMVSPEAECERLPSGFPAERESVRPSRGGRNGWDPEAWKKLLESGDTWDASATAILSAGLIEWAWQQLPRWLRGRPAQDWEEIRSEFVARVVGDQFVHLARARPGCREGYLRRWLANEVVEFYGKETRRRDREPFLDELPGLRDGEDPSLNLDMVACAGDDPVESLIRRERLRAIQRIVARMHELDRQLFHLHWVVGLTEAEAARSVNRPLGTVSTHLLRIKARVRNALGDDWR